MTNILVTGGAGYIGSFIIRKLQEEGFTPVIVDDLSSGHRDAVRGFKLVKLDLVMEKDRLNRLFKRENFQGVIHMASYIQMGESFINPLKYFNNNLVAAINLFDVMQKNNVKKLVFSSSAGVYGIPKKLPIKEDYPKSPQNPYGETKLMIENMLLWCDRAWELKSICIRYFNAAGAAFDGSIGEDHPNESHLIPLVIKVAIQGKEITIFGDDYKTRDGTCVRDYIHVIDLAKSHTLSIKALLKGSNSNYFNAGVGRGYSNLEIVEMIRKITGLHLDVKMGLRRPGDADSLYASVAKIKRQLKWKPKYRLKEIIDSAYKWHLTHPEGFPK